MGRDRRRRKRKEGGKRNIDKGKEREIDKRGKR